MNTRLWITLKTANNQGIIFLWKDITDFAASADDTVLDTAWAPEGKPILRTRMVSKLSRTGIWPSTHRETNAQTPNRPSFEPASQAVRPQEPLGPRKSQTENIPRAHGRPRQSHPSAPLPLMPLMPLGDSNATYHPTDCDTGSRQRSDQHVLRVRSAYCPNPGDFVPRDSGA